ncbi:fibronectin type III domain-containing protein [Candidatus Woesearchaeota archaeon]|nr:fibronectin type III domain-containing protein [Candidatus Woesearchaeota archaeon]
MRIKKRKVVTLLILLVLQAVLVLGEGINIENLGLTGIDQTNQEYTATRTVALNITLDADANTCAYSNNDISYTLFEGCTERKYWVLTTGTGLKTVYIQINHTDDTINKYNDTIYYNYTGAGLDTTPPTRPIITVSDYEKDGAITFSFDPSTDPESEILQIPLVYEYQISRNSIPQITWTVTNTYENTFNISVNHLDDVTIEVRTTNSAGLTNTSSRNIIIDQDNPSAPSISSSLDQLSYHNSNSVFFNWSANDAISSIGGYSYTLSQDISTTPDNVAEGTLGLTQFHTNKTFTLSSDGTYYFTIKAFDEAKNPSSTTQYWFLIDRTPPNKPTLISGIQYATSNNLTFNWEALDDLSGIDHFVVQLSDTEGDFTSPINETNITTPGVYYADFLIPTPGTYYARVKAVNNVGLESLWSNEEEGLIDTQPPNITIISPKNSSNITKDYSLISLVTDETATCYQYDAKYIEFIFTNSTYHETRLTQNFWVYIMCEDEKKNQRLIGPLNYNVTPQTPNVISPSSINSYAGFVINQEINLSNDAYGFENRDFNITLNGENIMYGVKQTNDSGRYVLSIKTPLIPGTYTLSISGYDITLYNKRLNFTASYQEGGLTPTTTHQTIYANTSTLKIGLMSQNQNNTYITSNSIGFTTGHEDKKLLFLTKELSNLENKEWWFNQDLFLNLLFARINAYSNKPGNARIIISDPHIVIEDKSFGGGGMSLKVRHERNENQKKVISITKNKQLENNIITN